MTALTTVDALIAAELAPVAHRDVLGQVADSFRIRVSAEMAGAITPAIAR